MLRLKQPNCGDGCGPCTSGGTPVCNVGTPTCASRTGSGNLRGWSKFQNENSGDWNTRKLTQHDAIARWCSELGNTVWKDLIRLNTWNTAADTCSTSESSVGNSIAGTGHCYESSVSQSAFCRMAWDSVADSCGGVLNSYTTTDYSKALSSPAATCVFTTDLAESISFPDTVDAALSRGSPSNGTLCKTTAGTIGSTSALSTTQIAITGTTSVVATIPLTGLTIGADYSIDILVNRYTAAGGAFVDQITVTVAFTASATSEDYDYDVPVNTDYDYEFDSVDACTYVP